MLQSENKRRDAEKRDDSYDDVYLTQELADGTKTEKRVDKVRCDLALIYSAHTSCQAFLDLTDIQNRDFRYVL